MHQLQRHVLVAAAASVVKPSYGLKLFVPTNPSIRS
jgi:hypothetical protein